LVDVKELEASRLANIGEDDGTVNFSAKGEINPPPAPMNLSLQNNTSWWFVNNKIILL
jgi:hypothetical protein